MESAQDSRLSSSSRFKVRRNDRSIAYFILLFVLIFVNSRSSAPLRDQTEEPDGATRGAGRVAVRGPRRETDRHPVEHEQQEAGPEERFPLHDPGGNIGERRAVRPEHQENRKKRLCPLHLRSDQRFRKRRHEYQHDRPRFESILN